MKNKNISLSIARPTENETFNFYAGVLCEISTFPNDLRGKRQVLTQLLEMWNIGDFKKERVGCCSYKWTSKNSPLIVYLRKGSMDKNLWDVYIELNKQTVKIENLEPLAGQKK